MERVIFRKQIEILFLSGKKPEEIHKILVEKYSSKAPCRATVFNWVRQVKWKDISLCDSPRSGAPLRAVTSSNIEKVRKAMEDNPKLSCRVLASMIKVSHESIRKILIEHLDMRKMNCRWVPKELNESQKKARVVSCRNNLIEWQDRWTELIERIVTVDETWIKYENSPSRLSGAEWRKRGSRPPEIPKLPSNARKIMATVFWDSKGILLFDILPNRSTVTGIYYSELLGRLREEIKSKRRGKLKKKPYHSAR
ncbi:histone-lysine N-methyltransferase SETMAR-like [Brevipalpus obovatus]|uniref:histone-lysine N-methyltransferase SETMAR-like n=1 Tax=Brevipalpus obovatus TaxID=246614 RepID=UPI003D9EF588